MSTENVSGQPPADIGTAKKKRSPVERVLVWGGILALLVVLLIEFRAQQGYTQSLNAVTSAFGERTEDLTLPDVEQLMQFAPAKSGPEAGELRDIYTYSWFSIFRTGQFQLIIETTQNEDPPIVLSYSTANPESPDESAAMDQNMGGGGPPPAAAMVPGGGSPGGGFPGGTSGPPPNPVRERLDADGDGELSAEEISAASTALLTLDRNDDGVLSEDEYAQDRPARPARPEAESASGEVPEILRIPDVPSSDDPESESQ